MKTVRFQMQLQRQFSLKELDETEQGEDADRITDGNTQTALVFDKGEIPHPTNKNVMVNLKGFFILTIPHGAFPKIPDYEMDRFDAMLRHWGTENHLLDRCSEISPLVFYPTKAVFLIAPALKPWNKKTEILLKGLLWWRICDQFFTDGLVNSLLVKEHFADFSKFITNIMTGLYRNTDCIPSFDIPFLNHAMQAFFNFYVELKENVAGYEQNYCYLLNELLNWIQSYKIRVVYMGSTTEELQQANYMFKKLCGKRSIIELIQLLTVTYVDGISRDNLLFKMFCNSADLIQAMGTDIFWFPKDAKSLKNSSNMILRNMIMKKMEFDEALHLHMDLVNLEIIDLGRTAEALLAEFPDSEQIQRYVHNYQCYVDGFIRMYSTQSRYGSCKFKIMKVVRSGNEE